MLQSKFWQCVSKDLISSDAKYHASCDRNYARSCYDVSEIEISEPLRNEADSLYEAIENYCRELTRSPRVVEFRSIRKVMSEKQEASTLKYLLQPTRI